MKTKLADTSLVSRVRTTAGTRRNNGQKQREDNSEGDICYLPNICGAGQTQTCTIEDKLNIDAGKHVLAMFFNLGIILNE